jgi:hypothetical protein
MNKIELRAQEAKHAERLAALSDEHLLTFSNENDCYNELFRRYGAKMQRGLMRICDGSEEMLQTFAETWFQIRRRGEQLLIDHDGMQVWSILWVTAYNVHLQLGRKAA